MMTDLLESSATFSPCRTWRYTLTRRWADGPLLCVLGLNPSTADETQDDPTIRRCQTYARDWGYAGLRMLNIFSFRATDPNVMKAAKDPVGPNNLQTIAEQARVTVEAGGAILAAWGNHGSFQNHSQYIQLVLEANAGDVACLGLTQAGEPKHPLYLRRDAKPIAFLGNGGRLVTEWKQ